MSSTLISPATAHSAQVHMHLNVGSASLPIAQLGPDFMILERQVTMRATEGEIVMKVDAGERRWTVTLPEGLSATSQRTPIAKK